MIRHVHERACLARRVDRVLVATDDQRIEHAVKAFGGDAVMTSPTHATGTDRIAEVAESCDAEIIVNVQGDEPMLDPASIDAAIAALLRDPALPISTLSEPLGAPRELLDASIVKVVVDAAGNALYFSRAAIPHFRGAAAQAASPATALLVALARKHVGLYAYRRDALMRLASLPRSPLEEAESLEQLRALHYGMRIRVIPVTAAPGVAVDTPEDLERARALMKTRTR